MCQLYPMCYQNVTVGSCSLFLTLRFIVLYNFYTRILILDIKIHHVIHYSESCMSFNFGKVSLESEMEVVCDQFTVSISSVRYTKCILSENQLKYFLYHENRQKLLGIWFFKDFQGVEFLGPNRFQEGVLSKNCIFFFFKLFIWDAKFPISYKI